MARPGDTYFLWALSAHQRVPGCQAPGCLAWSSFPCACPSQTVPRSTPALMLAWNWAGCFTGCQVWKRDRSKRPNETKQLTKCNTNKQQKIPKQLSTGVQAGSHVMLLPQQGPQCLDTVRSQAYQVELNLPFRRRARSRGSHPHSEASQCATRTPGFTFISW